MGRPCGNVAGLRSAIAPPATSRKEEELCIERCPVMECVCPATGKYAPPRRDPETPLGWRASALGSAESAQIKERHIEPLDRATQSLDIYIAMMNCAYLTSVKNLGFGPILAVSAPRSFRLDGIRRVEPTFAVDAPSKGEWPTTTRRQLSWAE
jgi:hypothetical protein